MSILSDPVEIEKRSFEIISQQLAGRSLDAQNISVIKRVIHTTADFDYADNLVFSEGVVATAKETLKKGDYVLVSWFENGAETYKAEIESQGQDIETPRVLMISCKKDENPKNS